MTGGARKSREGHDENAGAYGGFQLVSQDACEDQKHHHTSSRADKSADETDHNAADEGLDESFAWICRRHGFFGCHDWFYDEFDSQKEGHEYRETAHSLIWYEACDKTSDQGGAKHGDHHDDTVSDIEIFILSISISADGAGKNVACESDPYCVVCRHVKKCDEHRADYSGGAHSGETGS